VGRISVKENASIIKQMGLKKGLGRGLERSDANMESRSQHNGKKKVSKEVVIENSVSSRLACNLRLANEVYRTQE